ncbi:competence protein ComEC [Ensifer sp. WSM1721]|uniref:ComEC/Rec2 family competence protein n=1 Tax=Ensifer sp. WSM1721 TaxID=1041159 RepID=UPI00047876FB|nr:ComEC/Rec2 family competence protein [Ensifer sp. WSM1721]
MGEGQAQAVARDEERSAWRLLDDNAPVPTADLAVQGAALRSPPVRYGLIIRRRTVRAATSISRSMRAAAAEEQEFGHGFVLIPVLLALGALAWFDLPGTVRIAELAALLCVFGMSTLLCRGDFRRWRPFALAPALFTAGMLLAAAETARLDTVILDGPVTTNVRGTVISREPDDKGRWRYLVEIQETSGPRLRRPPARATLLARSRHEPFQVGAALEGKARLSPPSGPALPGLNDFAFDAYFKGVGAVGFFYGAPRVPAESMVAERQQSSLPARTSAFLTMMREAAGNRIRAAIGGDTGAIAAALVTGEERAISRETVEALRAAGLSHVLAISGLNMVLAAGTFLIGARTLLSFVPGVAERFPIKKIAAAGALLMVFLYILISGGAVSALRSWIMISIMLVAVFFDRISISLRNVALAALVIITWKPSAVAGPGFQMSFAATLALVAGYARWRDHRAKDREANTKRGGWGAASSLATGIVATSVIGGLATAVYAAAHFHRLPAYGLAANIAAAPLISVLVMPFALFAMLLMPFGLEHYPLMVMGQALDWMLSVARYVASLDGEWMTGRVGNASFFLVAFGGVLLCVLRTRLALAGAGLILLGGSAIALERNVERPSIAISEDGQLVGLIAGGTIATNRSRPPEFVFSQWQRALAARDHTAPLEIPAIGPERTGAPKLVRQPDEAEIVALLGAAKPGVFTCRKSQVCVGQSREGWTVAVVEAPELVPILCKGADLIVVATRRPLAACPSGVAVIVTGQTLRRTGAIEIYADQRQPGEPHMRVEASFASTERPWQRHRRYDWRSGDFLPSAPNL